MPGFIKQMFNVLMFQPCMVGPTLIDLNPDELYYYPFIISLDMYDGG